MIVKKMFFFILMVLLTVKLQAQVTFYVSTTGNDLNTGSQSQPLATLQGARDAIRNYKNENGINHSFEVLIESGNYIMKAPLELNAMDSGSSNFPIIYKAVKGAKPVFSGGKKITGFKVNSNGLWEAKIPESSYYKWNFDQLYVNNKRATLARTPNKGFIKIDTVTQTIWKHGTSKVAEKAEQSIFFKAKEAKILSEIKQEEIHNVRFKAFHKWDYTLRHIDAIDTDSLKLITSGKGMKPWNPLKKDRRLIFENYEAALDSVGEWYLKDNGTLLYKPLEGQTIANTEVIAPVLENLISISGTPIDNAKHITFEGLTFKHAHYKIPITGSEPNQAAAKLNAAILVKYANHIEFLKCEVSQIGQHAIWLGKGTTYSKVEHCYLHHLGGGGIYLGDFKPLDGKAHTNHISVENNIIQTGGQEFPASVGVWVGHSADNTISHNDIGNFYYTGISVGWVWGYKPSLAKRNTITYNHIHHIGWDLLSDMAGIYTLGASEGTQVTHNVINNVHAYSYGGWGMYADEGSSGITFKNNLVYNTKTGGFQQNYGKNNTVENNILAFAKKYQLQCTISEDHKSFTFTNNIILFKEGLVTKGAWDDVNADMDYNIYWNINGSDYNFNNHNFKGWKKLGFDKNSLISNPFFKDAESFNFNFKRNTTYKKINFKPFNYSEAGVYGSNAWVEKSKLSQSITKAFDATVKKNMKMKIKR